LNCPVCNQPLIILELNKIEIDYCTICQGIWLDKGELELLLEDSGEKNKPALPAGRLLDSFSIDKKNKEKKIRCPICFKKMDKVLYGYENWESIPPTAGKITIDRCSVKAGLHGLWFNKGELESVIKMGSLDEQNKIVVLLKEMFAYNLK